MAVDATRAAVNESRLVIVRPFDVVRARQAQDVRSVCKVLVERSARKPSGLSPRIDVQWCDLRPAPWKSGVGRRTAALGSDQKSYKMQVVIEIESERLTGCKRDIGSWAWQNDKTAGAGVPA